MEDKHIIHHIKALIDEEEHLYLQDTITDGERNRLHLIQTELDQYYDLLRQRRAKRDAGDDPSEAKLRSKYTVEHYKQ
jgi:hypothetical protein